MTAIKWVTRCYPELPMSLIQKLFRLRFKGNLLMIKFKNVDQRGWGAKDVMNYGDCIFLPVTVEKSPSVQAKANVTTSSEEEMKFLHSLIVYKDPAIIAVNRPPGMPVQVFIGIKRSLYELAAEYLRFNNSESPHRVVMENGKFERITVVDNVRSSLARSAVTEY